MKSVALKAYPRSQVQRAEVTKLRRAGRVPATIYGRQAQPQNLEVDYEEITDLLAPGGSGLQIRDGDAHRGVYVEDLSDHAAVNGGWMAGGIQLVG